MPVPTAAFDLDLMLQDLASIVNTESPSLELPELQHSAESLAALITERLGGSAELIESEAGPHVRWAGGDDSSVLLLGHHDTVFPLGTVAQRPFSLEDGIARGPGVFDMAAGIVQAVHAVASLEPADRAKCELLFSADEEVGSTHSKELIVERAQACGAVLVFEASLDGAVKTARKGTGTFTVTITGRASHAGLDPEKGINSLIEAAHQVLAIAEIGDAEAGTTVTPTVASSGTATNVVPAEAVIHVDVRVNSADEKARVEAAFAALTPTLDEAEVTVTGRIGRPPMPLSASAELFALVQQIRPDIDGCAVGGGSDGNFTAAAGVSTLDGLGAVGGGAHADHEHVLVDTMPDRAALVAGLIEAHLASLTTSA